MIQTPGKGLLRQAVDVCGSWLDFLWLSTGRSTGQIPDMPVPSTFNPKTKTARSIKQRDPSVSQFISGNHAEILVWGDALANNAPRGEIQKGLRAPFQELSSFSASSLYIEAQGGSEESQFYTPSTSSTHPITHLFGFKTYVFSSYSSQFPQRDSQYQRNLSFFIQFTCSTLHMETGSGALLWASVMKPFLILRLAFKNSYK